jgi:hypothetical protein
MNMMPKFLMLGLATALSSTSPQRQIDFGMPGADSQRLYQLWLVTYVIESGQEVLAQAIPLGSAIVFNGLALPAVSRKCPASGHTTPATTAMWQPDRPRRPITCTGTISA